MQLQHTISILLGIAGAFFIAVLFSVDVLAFDRSIVDGAEAARGIDQIADLFGSAGIITTITNILLFVVGAIAVIMVIIGGFRYVISGGNTANITTAKNTVLYAVVGLIVAILAYALVNFVLESFMPGGASGGTNV